MKKFWWSKSTLLADRVRRGRVIVGWLFDTAWGERNLTAYQSTDSRRLTAVWTTDKNSFISCSSLFGCAHQNCQASFAWPMLLVNLSKDSVGCRFRTFVGWTALSTGRRHLITKSSLSFKSPFFNVTCKCQPWKSVPKPRSASALTGLRTALAYFWLQLSS